MELLILSHAPTRVLEQGYIPAAFDLQLKVTILTDCVREHFVRAKESRLYAQCRLIECDVFNPLSVARFIHTRSAAYSGVLAADAVLRASAAVTAECLGLPGPSWRNAVISDQRLDLHRHLNSEAKETHRRIVNCSEPDTDLGHEWFPATVQPLEAGTSTGGAIVRNREELRRRLTDLRYGYALVEKYREGEEVYALDGLSTAEGFTVLCGSRIEFDADEFRTKRVHSFMPRPPYCDALLTQLSGFDLGVGRHHVEYAVADNGIRIREMHNGLHDDESEFALDDRLYGNVFREAINVSLGMPVKPLRLLRTDAKAAAFLEAAA